MSGAVALAVSVFPGTQCLAIFAAQAAGAFGRRGLAVDLHHAANSEQQRNGLAEGRYQIAQGAADQAVAMVEIARTDAAIVLGGDSGFNRLFVQPEVVTLADLRGRTLVVDVPHTGWSFALYKMLAQDGLARTDYALAAVGAPGRRFEAMRQDTAMAAAILNPPFSIRAQRAGLRDMGAVAAALGRYQGFVTYVMRAWARANADTLIAYLAAYIEGLRWSLDPANQAAAVTLYAERLSLPHDIAARVYEIAADPLDGLAVDAGLDLEGLETVLRLRAEFAGGVAAAPEKYVDLSYYRRALASVSNLSAQA
jgi:ABC-type nitrate/sulfonate/bicarbonate transport system substrate-binding protein